MKGKVGVEGELKDNGMARLNMRLQRVISFSLPFIDASRTLLFFAPKESGPMKH
jgi:hypothetical protein